MAAGPRVRETTVGVLFFLALGLLGIFTVLIGEMPVFSSTWTFDVVFNDVGGLEKGQDVLYAGGRIGKVSDADCFRIGNIGRIFEPDVRDLLRAIAETLGEMGLK